MNLSGCVVTFPRPEETQMLIVPPAMFHPTSKHVVTEWEPKTILLRVGRNYGFDFFPEFLSDTFIHVRNEHPAILDNSQPMGTDILYQTLTLCRRNTLTLRLFFHELERTVAAAMIDDDDVVNPRQGFPARTRVGHVRSTWQQRRSGWGKSPSPIREDFLPVLLLNSWGLQNRGA